MVGLTVTAFSLVRLKYVHRLSLDPNITRVSGVAGIYSNVEVSSQPDHEPRTEEI